jgi:tetratricopeptide (TPR) repeat protein
LDFSLTELDKNNLRVRAERAYVAFKTGKENEGQEHLDLALNLRGRYPRVQEIKALSLGDQGNVEEARQILEGLTAQHPKRIETMVLLAQMTKETVPEKSRAILEQAMAIVYPKEEELAEEKDAQAPHITDQILVSRLHTAYGLLEERMGVMETAINHQQKAWDLFKYNYTSAVALVRLYKKSGREDEASTICQKLKEMDAPEKYLNECKM